MQTASVAFLRRRRYQLPSVCQVFSLVRGVRCGSVCVPFVFLLIAVRTPECGHTLKQVVFLINHVKLI